MDKRHLARALAGKTNLPVGKAVEVIEALTTIVIEAVANGEKVAINGFGSFNPRLRAARMGRILGTDKKIAIPARTVPVFKAGIVFCENVASKQP